MTGDDEIRVRKADFLDKKVEPARLVVFTPDGSRLLAATLDNVIQMIDVATGRLIHEFLDHRNGVCVDTTSSKETSPIWLDSKLAQLAGTIRTMAVSHDGQWLASGDSVNRVFVYHLDSLQLHTIVPMRDTAHVHLSFEPHRNHLIVVNANHFFVVYDVELRAFAEFSQRYPSESDFPKAYLNRPEKIIGTAFNPARPYSVIFYGLSFMCLVDLNKVRRGLRYGVGRRNTQGLLISYMNAYTFLVSCG
jgi:U3 small nucleolar RNA-associated protein 4